MGTRFHLDKRADRLADTAAAEGHSDDLLSSKQVADLLGVGGKWLGHRRRDGDGPAFIRLGPKRLRYGRRDVEAFLRERTLRMSEYLERLDSPERALEDGGVTHD